MRRTLLAAIAAGAAAAALTVGLLRLAPQPPATILAYGAFLAGLLAMLLAIAAIVSIGRQKRIYAGKPDLFLKLNGARSETSITSGISVFGRSPMRRWLAAQLGHHLLVGDLVRIRPLEEIRKTLDGDGALDGLPFMDEMAAFCGRSARVYRVVDKIYDYGRSRGMRRLDDAVTLAGLRCDGSAHGNCAAACYLIWKRQWLERIDGASASTPADMVTETHGLPLSANAPLPSPARETAAAQVSYRCQYTQLHAATRPIHAADLTRLFGAPVVGNVTLAAFLVAALTRYFNLIQTLRGGVRYPSMPMRSGVAHGAETVPIRRGQQVRVRTPHQIALTLDKNSRNRGLWFDSDMLKHCGQAHQVLGRVDRIIDVTSGHLITMKTPCIVLAGAHYSGEFQWFGEQHDFLYWRESWLEPTDDGGAAQSTA